MLPGMNIWESYFNPIRARGGGVGGGHFVLLCFIHNFGAVVEKE